jgi:hypothetical protein
VGGDKEEGKLEGMRVKWNAKVKGFDAEGAEAAQRARRNLEDRPQLELKVRAVDFEARVN